MSIDLPSIPENCRITVDQYHAMIRAGILTDDDHVELLRGLLVPMAPKTPSHSVCTHCTLDALARVLPLGWHVYTHEPVTTPDSEPEPDVSVVRGELDRYADRHPTPGDVGLLVEVADASLDRDRGPKKRLYAAARIPVYWVANLVQRQIEVFTDPFGSGEHADFAQCQVYRSGDELPIVLNGREVGRVKVGELLP